MGIVTYYVCDICGKKEQCPRAHSWRRIQRFIFHYELECRFICSECLEQLKAMREANMIVERKEQ